MEYAEVVLDTNILLESPEIIEDGTSYRYIIPAVVLKELDDLKRKRKDLGYAVRNAARIIFRNLDKITVDFEGYETSTNDESIVKVAQKYDQLYTEDILMTILAKNQGISVFNPVAASDEDYAGYVEHQVSDEQEELISHMYRSQITIPAPVVNRNILEVPTSSEYLITHHGSEHRVYQYSAKDDVYKRKLCKEISVFGSTTIRAKDVYQEVALISAKNPEAPMTVLDGLVGTGKTLIALVSALTLVQDYGYQKIYISRPPLGIDNRFDIGFLPGSTKDKLDPWVGGILSNLEYLFGENRAEDIFERYFKHFPVNMAQGYSIHNSVLIVDEAQLLSVDVLRQIMSRVAEGSKLILLGDDNQNYNIIPRSESGFLRLRKILPNPNIEYVKLKNIYRGPLAQLSMSLC